MSRRRETRRRRRRERRRPPQAEPGSPAFAPSPGTRVRRRDVSWVGLVGALTGTVPFAITGAFVLADPGQGSRWWAIPLLVMAVAFAPAAWASVVATPHRRRVLRASTVGCLIVAAGGALYFGLGFAVLLATPTALLAIASGYLFQGGRNRR